MKIRESAVDATPSPLITSLHDKGMGFPLTAHTLKSQRLINPAA